jgi:hypothetical protein
MEKNNIIVFLDNIGRVIVGTKLETEGDIIYLVNPAIVSVDADPQSPRLVMQLFPLFYKELQGGDKETEIVWNFNAKNITAIAAPFELDDRFRKQYDSLFNAAAPVAPANNVIKLEE